MPLIDTSTLGPDTRLGPETQQVYCGLDCCLTTEIFEELGVQYPGAIEGPIYSFERALQGPYLDIMTRGFATDDLSRREAAAALHTQMDHALAVLNEFALAVWDKPLNPNSPKQLQEFFYGAMRLPEIWISQKGEKKLSTNREVLERLFDSYPHSRPFVNSILEFRDCNKQLNIMEMEVDKDKRFRTSYNIAGTECVAGDTLIWTKGGLRKMEEIYSTPHAVAVWNGAQFITPARKVKYQARKGFEIWVEGGYKIKCSDNHPIMTQRGFVQASDLTKTDSIHMNFGLPELFGQHALPRGGILDQMSEDFMEFFGMILADGSLNATSEHYRCRLSNSDWTAKERFKELVKLVFGLEATTYGDEVSFSSKEVCLWLQSLGFPADSGLGTASFKEIPAELMRGKPNLLRALLRGLTLDSHVTEKGLMFGTQSYKLQEQIQQILLVLGIAGLKLYTGNSIKLNVPRRYCGRFISMIGFVQQNRLEKLSALLNERSQWHEPAWFGAKVLLPITQIDDWTGDVFDLTMPESSPPQYVANGMTVHNTGRPSSSENAFGTGSNAQNISPALRYVFVADPGYKLGVIDLEQVEARDVGFFCGCLFDDWRFLDACESGDLHTNNAKLIWPEKDWTGDSKKDKEIAQQIFYRDFSFRDMAKRGGHLTNYFGTAWTAARSLKVPVGIMEEFQARYVRGGRDKTGREIIPAYACIAQWWTWTAEQLQTTHSLTTPFGRKRHFFGRPNDDTTLREAIAFLPQSTTADRMNLGLWRTWANERRVQLLAQTYDSITFQFREDSDVDEIISHILELLRVVLHSNSGREYSVPGEAKVGWNWGYEVTAGDRAKAIAQGKRPPRVNPEGLRKWTLGKPDDRTRQTGLNRIIR